MKTTTTHDAKEAILYTLGSAATSAWLKSALRAALQRDPVDAANDAEELARLLNIRCNLLLDDLRAKGGSR